VKHKVGTREEWLAARIELLEREKELTRRSDELAGLLFVGSYLAVWTLVGLAVYPLYRPHGTAVAGALTIAALVPVTSMAQQEGRNR
jgi:hypothetical protein